MPAPFDYFVFGSRSPGVFNLGGDLGSDNERVFHALGISAEDMAALKKENII